MSKAKDGGYNSHFFSMTVLTMHNNAIDIFDMSGHWSDRSDHVSKHGDFHGNVSHESVPIGCHDIRVTTPNCERRFHCAASRHPLHLLACVRRRFPDVELRAEKRGHVHSGGKGVGESEYGQKHPRSGRVPRGQGDWLTYTQACGYPHICTHRTRGPGPHTPPKIFPKDAKNSPSLLNPPRAPRQMALRSAISLNYQCRAPQPSLVPRLSTKWSPPRTASWPQATSIR